jgi:hypothetical protein
MMPRVFYRIADQITHRDMVLIAPYDPKPSTVARFTAGKCVLSTSSARGGWLAWEGADRIEFSNPDRKLPVRLVGKDNPKHPSMAVNRDRKLLLAWTERTSWDRGGSLVWQLFDRDGKPIPNATGRADDLPAWDTPAAVGLSDGNFVIFY